MCREELKKRADENWEDISEIVERKAFHFGDVVLEVERPDYDLCYIYGRYLGENPKYYGKIVFCWEGTTEGVLKILEDISDVEPTERRKERKIKRLYEELTKELKDCE